MWCTPLFPALQKLKQVNLRVWSQPGLQSEFWDSQSYTEKFCLEPLSSFTHPQKKAGLNLKALWGSKGSLSEGKERRKLEVLSVYHLSSGSASLLSDWNTERTNFDFQKLIPALKIHFLETGCVLHPTLAKNSLEPRMTLNVSLASSSQVLGLLVCPQGLLSVPS